jgi:hypothetical protein
MDNISRLKELCQGFIDRKYDIEELQQRLQTAIFPDDLYEQKMDILNALEEIRFTKLESNHYKYALEVVLNFLKRIEEIK